ncbi:MAG: hypothetical protein COC22_04015 [Flavobacteriaceae bacterium]|nr:MAG: hypothetical protein COC22_04015 [Flavobacteriaceae bacterium]
MKKLFLALITITLFSNCTKQKTTYEDEIKHFQYELNREYADASTSPLTKEDLKTFKSLDFFKIDKNYSIEAKLERTPNSPIFEMQTSTTEIQLYKTFAIASFKLNGKKFKLNLYKSQDLLNNPEYLDYLFLPFNDKTNGNLSYGGGRFLDLKIPSEDSNTVVIDFNKAYNPYCAYSLRYSCPIPPSENNLSIAINAGVKAYKEHH